MHGKRTKAEQAAQPTQPKGKSKAQSKAAKAKSARQVAGQGLQCSAQHAAHWGEQASGNSVGGRHSRTMSVCIGYSTQHLNTI
ncbi:hypothetical protein HaLaN_00444 [Haematococcus lacustris]|uniref:Uncharacterized protein n=1 Tax=Haematococcus lacustris TaxID=44745 RepID=A0A699YS49_HAELA|nr:hypothetical protein HaLaN_00444 [Haematococcus lacustris]